MIPCFIDALMGDHEENFNLSRAALFKLSHTIYYKIYKCYCTYMYAETATYKSDLRSYTVANSEPHPK